MNGKLAKQLRWLPARLRFYLREAMRARVTVRDPEDGRTYAFRADSLLALRRAKSLLTKEPKTIAWLRRNVRPSDVFLDVGANIGTFSIFAAARLSAAGRVYACEPHLPTAVQLLQNIAANGVDDRVSVLSVAASNVDGFFPFEYTRWSEGASGSQLAAARPVALRSRVGGELKSSLTIDTMIEKGLIRAPDLIKIDTDGLELAIVEGMKRLLEGPNRPRSLLVEVQPGELEAQTKQMAASGYRLVETHRLTPDGKGTLNAVFEPAA